jgi:hypothetical protein
VVCPRWRSQISGVQPRWKNERHWSTPFPCPHSSATKKRLAEEWGQRDPASQTSNVSAQHHWTFAEAARYEKKPATWIACVFKAPQEQKIGSNAKFKDSSQIPPPARRRTVPRGTPPAKRLFHLFPQVPQSIFIFCVRPLRIPKCLSRTNLKMGTNQLKCYVRPHWNLLKSALNPSAWGDIPSVQLEILSFSMTVMYIPSSALKGIIKL